MEYLQSDDIKITWPANDNLEKILADTKRYDIQFIRKSGKLTRVIFENETDIVDEVQSSPKGLLREKGQLKSLVKNIKKL